MKEQLTREIITAASAFLAPPQIDRLERCIVIALHDYDIRPAETAMVPTCTSTERAFRMFIASKKVEGLSEKTLKYYAMEIRALLLFVQKPIEQIGSNDVRFYLAVIQSQKPNISKVTLDNKRRVYNSFFGLNRSLNNVCSASSGDIPGSLLAKITEEKTRPTKITMTMRIKLLRIKTPR